jgi:MerR family transcriptional regulator, light-induced transcriptional regulator
MCPRKKSTNAAGKNSTAAAWLTDNIAAITAEATDLIFASRPDLQARYCERGRKKCEEDTTFHLHYLAEAIANDSESMFSDYIGWAKTMLSSRGIPSTDLAQNLQRIGDALSRKSPSDCRAVFAQFLRFASEALPEQPDKLRSFIDPTNPFADLANSYLSSLLVMNREEAESLVMHRVSSGLSTKDLLEHVIYPVQQEIGRLWQENRVTVVQEHYCTAATDTLIARLRHSFRGMVRSVSALLVCAEGEQHCLGLKMFANILEADGWRVTYAGSNCPATDVLKQVRTTSPDLLAISVATSLALSSARQLISEVRSMPLAVFPRILVGGRAFGSQSDLWKRVQADGSAPTVSEGLTLANYLVAGH